LNNLTSLNPADYLTVHQPSLSLSYHQFLYNFSNGVYHLILQVHNLLELDFVIIKIQTQLKICRLETLFEGQCF